VDVTCPQCGKRTAANRSTGLLNGHHRPGTHEPCSSSGAAFWPVPHTSQPHALDVAGVPATLVISTANDPATPYRSGVNLAKDLKGRLLTFEGTPHTVFLQGNACVDKVGTDCLVGGTLPADTPLKVRQNSDQRTGTFCFESASSSMTAPSFGWLGGTCIHTRIS
jgi:hypothetical protein